MDFKEKKSIASRLRQEAVKCTGKISLKKDLTIGEDLYKFYNHSVTFKDITTDISGNNPLYVCSILQIFRDKYDNRIELINKVLFKNKEDFEHIKDVLSKDDPTPLEINCSVEHIWKKVEENWSCSVDFYFLNII